MTTRIGMKCGRGYDGACLSRSVCDPFPERVGFAGRDLIEEGGNHILVVSLRRQSSYQLVPNSTEIIAFGLREIRSPIPGLSYRESLVSVLYEMLKLNGLAVDMLEDIVEDTRGDEVSLAGW